MAVSKNIRLTDDQLDAAAVKALKNHTFLGSMSAVIDLVPALIQEITEHVEGLWECIVHDHLVENRSLVIRNGVTLFDGHNGSSVFSILMIAKMLDREFQVVKVRNSLYRDCLRMSGLGLDEYVFEDQALAFSLSYAMLADRIKDVNPDELPHGYLKHAAERLREREFPTPPEPEFAGW